VHHCGQQVSTSPAGLCNRLGGVVRSCNWKVHYGSEQVSSDGTATQLRACIRSQLCVYVCMCVHACVFAVCVCSSLGVQVLHLRPCNAPYEERPGQLHAIACCLSLLSHRHQVFKCYHKTAAASHKCRCPRAVSLRLAAAAAAAAAFLHCRPDNTTCELQQQPSYIQHSCKLQCCCCSQQLQHVQQQMWLLPLAWLICIRQLYSFNAFIPLMPSVCSNISI
jgi:hypothetical protein